MTTTCSTEQCDTTATHTDQFNNPICQECVDGAIFNGEPATAFTPIEADTQPEWDELMEGEPVPADLCHYDHGHFCGLPECMISDRCTNQGCRHRPVKDITIFEESLTALGLEKISAKAILMPALAKTTEEYALVYEFSTALKRGSVAARKKIKELKRDLKKQYNKALGKIEKDLAYVLNIIDPIIKDLLDSRDYMECWTEALKMNKARKLAAKQEAERTRIRLEKKKQQEATATQQDQKKKELDEVAAVLKQERYEFECEKSRLSVDEAWSDHEFLKPAADLLKTGKIPLDDGTVYDFNEKATDEPAAPVNPYPSAGNPIDTSDVDYTESTERSVTTIDDENGIIQSTTPASGPTFQTENFSDGPASIIYSTDPAEKEKQLLDTDTESIDIIESHLPIWIKFLESAQASGFESKTATTATRRLIEDIQAAADRFTASVTPRETEPEPEITDSDVPF